MVSGDNVVGEQATLVHLAGEACSVVLDLSSGVPAISYWGSRLPEAAVDPASWISATTPAISQASLDQTGVISLVPERASGHLGRPGLAGHRPDGSGWSPRFSLAEQAVGAQRDLQTRSVDQIAGLELRCVVRLDPADVLIVAVTVTNIGNDPYQLDSLAASIALPQHADELLTFAGRWCGEFDAQRAPWAVGLTSIENRTGRTSHDRVPALFAGSTAFTHGRGDVWGLHLAWSGNASLHAEVLIDGTRQVQLGELLLPGEIVLAPGDSYTTPEIYGAYSSNGLDAASGRFHRHLRSRATHPGPDRPRPVLLNTWEAVYFNHDLDTLKALADRAAEVGAERYVLDDGWFHGRRDDTAGLGDWWVDSDVWSNGLEPLIEHVTGLGLEFGIWVEPEMVNPDSDVYRAHPDWVLTADDYDPVLGRNQLVLNLANPEVFEYLLGHLDALLASHDVGYVKWDMNRNLTHASNGSRAGVHSQTLAVYALIDALRARHPDVEIESCSSGGGRADFEILKRTDRVWTSDSNDALDRQSIQRGFSYLFPPELMGAHIGPPTSHTTRRRHSLAFRAATAFFGHLGIEWNLLKTSDDERVALGEFIALYKQHRGLLHTGDVRRFDHPDASLSVHGVVGADQLEAIVAVTQVASRQATKPGPVRIAGLLPEQRYAVQVLPMPQQGRWGSNHRIPPWMEDGLVVTGAFLAQVGLAVPVLDPESTVMLHLIALPGNAREMAQVTRE